MRWGLGISLFIHTAILAAAVIVLPSPNEYDVDDIEAIPIEIVNIEDESKRVAQALDAPDDVKEPANKSVEKPIAQTPAKVPMPKQEAVVVPPSSAPEVPPLPEKEPPKEDAPKEPEKAEPQPEDAEKKVAEKPTPIKPRSKPKPPKKVVKKEHKFDTNDIAALLNKQDDQGAPEKDPKKTGTPKKGEVASRGEDDRLSADQVDWLRQRVSQCWNPPIGVVEAERLRVTLDIELSIDGLVRGQPKVIAMSNHPLVNVAAESVVRAVMRCQPYDRLDKAKYKSWEKIRMNFDLRDMIQS